MKRSRKEQTKEVIEFIQKNPSCTIREVHDKTRINIYRLFRGISNAYEAAGVPYLDRKNINDKKSKKVINYVKRHPLATLEEITKRFHICVYKRFKSLSNLFRLAGITPLKNYEKRSL